MTNYFLTPLEFSADWQSLLWRSPFTWAVPVVLFFASLWLLYPWFDRGRAERRVRATIARMGKSALRDVSLDNGVEGFVFIDYLVLTPREILVVSLMNARGIVFGGEKIESWARVVGRRTHKFPNPLEASKERVLAVKYHVPEVEVRGLVLFGENSAFPKGKPDGVMVPQEITTDAASWEQALIPARVQAAWDKLAEMARRGEETYSREVLLLRGNPSHAREAVALALMVIAIAWGALHLLA
jgi:hypothetical protein